MNTELFEKVKAKIRQNPKHFDMEYWLNDTDVNENADGPDGPRASKVNWTPFTRVDEQTREQFSLRLQDDSIGCGTTACIAGWAIVCDPENAIKLDPNKRSMHFSYADLAMELLGTPNIDIFFVDGWPDKFRDEMNALTINSDGLYDYPTTEEGYRRCAEIACEAIDDYIKTNGWKNED